MSNPYPYPRKTRALIHRFPLSVVIPSRISTCSKGECPVLLPDDHDEDEPDSELEEGDWIFVATPEQPTEYIRAGSTISQRLAEMFKLQAKLDRPSADDDEAPADVPEHFQEFKSVFSKESFDALPEARPWGHAIELVPEKEPSGCKVYLLLPKEQKELDVFLQENLETGRIHPSKSPMASPVFFIKKKDGSLRLVQDYRDHGEKQVPITADL
jgi:hypothetical protein